MKYPRIWLQCDHKGGPLPDSWFQRVAQYDGAILGDAPTADMNRGLPIIRAANPSCTLLTYRACFSYPYWLTSSNENDPSQAYWKRWRDYVDSIGGWAHKPTKAGGPPDGWWGADARLTPSIARAIGDYIARVDCPGYDGIMLDQAGPSENISADNIRIMMLEIKRRLPNLIIFQNAWHTCHYGQDFKDVTNGSSFEFFDTNATVQGTVNWNGLMVTGLPDGTKGYIESGKTGFFQVPPLSILGVSAPEQLPPTDWVTSGVTEEMLRRPDWCRRYRFALGSACLSDGILLWCNEDLQSSAFMYDEARVNVATGVSYATGRLSWTPVAGEDSGKGWLGAATGDAHRTLVPGCWARGFEHGVVLVNPTLVAQVFGYGTPSPYRLIQGTVDPQHNPGGLASAVVVPPMDCVMLVRA